MNKFENCEGCNGACPINLKTYNDKENRCPCTTCVVKMMCRNSCKDYYLFCQKMYDSLKKQKQFVITPTQPRG